MAITSQSVSQAKILSCSITPSLSPSIFQSKKSSSLVVSSTSIPLHGLRIQAKNQRNLVAAIYSSEADITSTSTLTSTVVSETWLLEPVGDGDTKHIGFKVEMPDAFEISSDEVTVGRLPEKADMVIPVATVSGVHARIQKKGGNLLVTDLDSTNGTFVDDKRLRPGVVSPVSSGSCITFGDTHLAIFRVSKLEKKEDKSDSSAVTTETS
ncbi:hypothetical protein JRO89_XS10G0215600 [Xanthoceras sorbifolium]|uniref:FHA domain-containing protein n=1 Tax=Xanthoceras sorbifolium TaxID=99658 RepID=A0ABQ8HJV4_9ROSI|nr:hypothetical protein JRO89_XS10G0215600 [Xanthoceras sorbifolium]